jgi:hypothetical protein
MVRLAHGLISSSRRIVINYCRIDTAVNTFFPSPFRSVAKAMERRRPSPLRGEGEVEGQRNLYKSFAQE